MNDSLISLILWGSAMICCIVVMKYFARREEKKKFKKWMEEAKKDYEKRGLKFPNIPPTPAKWWE